MAKKDARRRKAIIAERSRQARINEAKRVVTKLPSYTDNKLDRLTDAQLRQLASSLGQQAEQRRAAVIKEAQRQYYTVPKISVSKLDREMASRPPITDQQIASQPPRKQHTMRQQQRRREAAREKIKRSRYYDAQRQQMSILQAQQREKYGENAMPSMAAQRMANGNQEMRDMLNMKNVLSNKKFVNKMDKNTLKKEIKDTHKRIKTPEEKQRDELYRLYKKAKREKNKKNRAKEKQKRNIRRMLTNAQLKGAIDKDTARMFARLTNKQVKWLRKNTNFFNLLKKFAHKDSPKGKLGQMLYNYEQKRKDNETASSWESVREWRTRHIYTFVSDDEKQKQKAKQSLVDFMAMAKSNA